MPRPKTVFVAPYDYKIVFDSDLAKMANSNGLCGSDVQEIRVDSGLGEAVEREVVLHEAMHAIWNQTGLEKKFKDEDEEEIIWTLSPRLLQLLRDNPKLVAYLTEGRK